MACAVHRDGGHRRAHASARPQTAVQIANDFTRPANRPDGSPGEIRRDEAMFAYVAVTRAMDVLDNDGLAWIRDYT